MKSNEEKIREQLVQAFKLIKQEEKKVEIILVENVKRKEELVEMKIRLATVDGENNMLKQRFGWEGITDEEMRWVMKNNPKGFSSFVPTLETIRREMKK